MRGNEEDGRPLLLGERKELRRNLVHKVAVERYVGIGPEAKEHRKPQQLDRRETSPSCSALFHQLARPGETPLSSRAPRGPYVDQSVSEPDLSLDPLADQGAVTGKLSNWVSPRVKCATASTKAERESDCRPALHQRPAAFSINAASV